jgi:hypothetical protein
LDLFEIERLPCKLFKANYKELKVSDLIDLIAVEKGIDNNKLAILIRHEPLIAGGDIKIEYYNYDCKEFGIDKNISDMNTKLHHGSILYIEEIQDGAKYESLNWHKAIQNETDMLTLNVDLTEYWPGDDGMVQMKMTKEKTIDYLYN